MMTSLKLSIFLALVFGPGNMSSIMNSIMNMYPSANASISSSNIGYVQALQLGLDSPKKSYYLLHRNRTKSSTISTATKSKKNNVFPTGLSILHQHQSLSSTSLYSSTFRNNDNKNKSYNTKLILGVPIIITSFISILYKLLSNQYFRQSINTFFVKYPYLAAFVICACKASTADLVVQKSTSSTPTTTNGDGSSKTNNTEKISSFEYKRNLAFFFYGGAYQGCVQEHIFNHVFPFLFGNGVDIRTVATKVFVDMLIISPFLCLPVAYMIKGAIYKNSFVSSIKRYIHDVRVNNLLMKNWMGEFICL